MDSLCVKQFNYLRMCVFANNNLFSNQHDPQPEISRICSLILPEVKGEFSLLSLILNPLVKVDVQSADGGRTPPHHFSYHQLWMFLPG